jgi:NADH-ubiquinone oxidoreductase chain 3
MTSTTFFMFFIPILSVLLLCINLLLAPHNPYQEKNSVFECGYHSFRDHNRRQFSISFFIIGFVFLLFDIDVALVYPYSVSEYSNGVYGLCIFLGFCLILGIGLVFEIGKNALTIDSKQTFSFNTVDYQTTDLYMSKQVGLQSGLLATFPVKY